ncbi:MAG: Tex family protein [Paludibacter sp.]|nr:Tex family protein [Paludibacter sp.]MDD4197872.1 Tex family protein [Paludibacter sp.]MDD4428138.1 Tex family protein [Paludibacter sp.]
MSTNTISPVFLSILTESLHLNTCQVSNTIQLLQDGATIPFVSRYRKELTGELDEVQIEAIKEQYDKLLETEKRKETILKTIEELGKLTPELKNRIDASWNATELEDIYLPFKPKRRTRAEIARENGLEPLAKIIMKQNADKLDYLVKSFVKDKISSMDEALNGASDIIAEWINESEKARHVIRRIFTYEAFITSKIIKGKEEDAQKYRDYFDMSEKLSKCSSHRLLAMRRGESEGFLKVSISPDEDKCIEKLVAIFVKADNASGDLVYNAIKDAYKRLLKPSIENEFASASKLKADTEAIRVFAENLRQLLLAPPLGEKRVLGIDPGFRTGCKVVCLDAQGNLLHNETIYPHPPQSEYAKSSRSIQKMVEAYNIQAIAIGNGTAGRETENFIQNIRYDRKVQVFVVSENGASIYSASKIAREEFPNYDVTVRGAISIGRRLMDPLAELVKIDPKSIGVGQYQHDVDQTLLKNALDQTIENAVNKVGVNLNTSSRHLLTYISGLGPQLAQNIVDYRSENGSFKNRKQLLKVPKMGNKTFEQCAGFLRIPDGENPLDNSAVHPESYPIVEKMAKDLKTDISQLIRNKELIQKIDLKSYVTENIGLPTLKDILLELEKPGRDPRSNVKVLEFDHNIKKIEDLVLGMEVPGIITNITNFGAFVDIGIKENGLVHISQMADRYISNPAEVVSLHQHVKVRVLEIDLNRKRVQLKLI